MLEIRQQPPLCYTYYMKSTPIPIKEPERTREAFSFEISEPGSEDQFASSISLASLAGHCKQWFKVILGLTTTDASRTTPVHTLLSGGASMHILKEAAKPEAEGALHYNPSFNALVRKNANVQFNHTFPLKASDENSDGAIGTLPSREKSQKLRTGFFPQLDRNKIRKHEPRKPKPEETNVSGKQGAEALQAVTEQLAQICSWQYIADTERFICSDFAHALLKIPQGEKLNGFQSFLPYFAEEEQAALAAGWSQALEYGKELNYIARLGHVQEKVWVKLIVKPVFEEGKLLHVIGTIQDVTASKENELSLLAGKIKAEEATKAKSEFVSLMSHEIRTPLSAIMGLTYLLLQEDNLAQEHKDNLQSIHFSSQNMLSLINNTLDYARVEAGKIELEKVNFQLKYLLKNIHRSLSIRAAEKRLKLNLCMDDNIPSEVAGDPARLTQILNNLMSNAIKFTDKGSVTVSVDVVYQSDSDWVLEFTVADTGVGIPEDRQQQIFESFVQASTATHRKYGGTGLGLAITKKIIELHNGSIQLRSTPGVGSEFSVRLRFVKPDISFETMKMAGPADDTASHLKDARVLVVDDNALNNMVASKLLVSWQAEVETAGDGHAAIEKLREGSYDIVLMDLHMPVINGFDAITEIRRMGHTMPIIALTANASEEEKKRILAIGGNDYLTKPFVPQELHDRIQQLLQPVCF